MASRTAVRIALPMFIVGFVVGSWLAAEPVRVEAAESEIGPVEAVSYTSRACCARRCGRCSTCRPRYYVPAPSVGEEGVTTDESRPLEEAPSADTSAVAPESIMAGGLGAAPAPGAVTPNMIGDSLFTAGTDIIANAQSHGFRRGTLPLAGGDRRFKMAENTSPRPQDRVFFNYNHFQNALIDINGLDHNLDRFTFGIEKTFLCDLASIEFRVPFSSALDSTQIVSGSRSSNAATEFGNVGLALKGVLWQDCRTLISAGLAMTFPTGDDAVLLLSGGLDEIRIDNDVVHLQPFIGILQTPTDRLFVQGYLQFDFSTAESGATYVGGAQAPQTQALYEQHLVYLDVSMGYWLHRNRCARRLTGIAPMIELHYTSTLNDATTPTIAGGILSNSINQLDSVNLTGGLIFELGPQTNLTVAGVAPMRRGDGRLFDSEIVVQLNRRF